MTHGQLIHEMGNHELVQWTIYYGRRRQEQELAEQEAQNAR